MQAKRMPQTLQEAVVYFADPEVALQTMIDLRWADGVICPRCGSPEVKFMASVQRWNCRGCRKQFSAKVGTIFEDSPLSLGKWFAAVWLIANDKNGVSSYEVARALGVTQKTAWFMLHRIRVAMETETFEKLSGEVEVDETLIGGKARFQHKEKKHKGRGGLGKAIVMGLIERGKGKDGTSKVRAQVVPDQKGKTLRPPRPRARREGRDGLHRRTGLIRAAGRGLRVRGDQSF